MDQQQKTSLGQALNAAYSTGKNWKNSGNYPVEGFKGDIHIFHVSAGKQGKDGDSVTLFFFFSERKQEPEGDLCLIALGEHVGNDKYKIDDVYGQIEAPFQQRKTV